MSAMLMQNGAKSCEIRYIWREVERDLRDVYPIRNLCRPVAHVCASHIKVHREALFFRRQCIFVGPLHEIRKAPQTR